ncbi:hypothetical protein BO71DRAFT_484803 [Aspergillus ellipticus CBS 707.79]|uniref:Myb-like domain-containing protein n=1 Tax=Aspergillus ellipticus CBS 707.79 TaxID=1448320 RepID=A0A319D7I8_9EURO|nr:hypothetical protein BO71DRAFT_484803 [Aspergillus ellipticus CBS 707.79]
MLLPSALPRDTLRQPRLAPSDLFTTPPPSDDDFLPPSGNGLLGTCRALQSLLSVSPAPCANTKRLQSPLQLRSPPSARSRKQSEPSRLNLSPSLPPRGANKRRRDAYESDTDRDTFESRSRFSTPKRRRQVPYDLPLGLSSSDFQSLRSPPVTQSPPSPQRHEEQEPSTPTITTPYNPDSAIPSIEDPKSASRESSLTDECLVNLVLQKIQLSKQDWDDCARILGQEDDGASLGRRWETLLRQGNVGIRRPDEEI